jgi:hypothetical protein
MIWCRYAQNGPSRYGVVEHDAVVEVDGSPFERWEPTGRRLDLQRVKLLPPTVPSTFFCVGLNYRGHVAHAVAGGNPVAKIPRPAREWREEAPRMRTGDGWLQPCATPSGRNRGRRTRWRCRNSLAYSSVSFCRLDHSGFGGRSGLTTSVSSGW